MQSLQNRILGAWPTLEAKTPAELLRLLKGKLLQASKQDLLRTRSDEIHKWVKLDPPKVSPPKGAPPDANIIVGAIKDFRRQPTNALLVRDDGAWLHFTITLRKASNILQVLAYDFELVFPEGMGMPPFYRIDLNLEDHKNQTQGLRSHCHPGNEDLQAPAPVMTPDEILDLLLWGMRPRHADKPRA